MAVTIQWLGHAAFRLSAGVVVYIDPWKHEDQPGDGDVILVSHGHYDHFSERDIKCVARKDARIISTADVIDKLGYGEVIKPGGSVEVGPCRVTAVAAYNPDKHFHPLENEWVGFVVELEGKRIYYAGDTDLIAEMEGLGEIDLALLPVGGTYTMNPEQAAAAASRIKPKLAIPYHWGDIVGGREDAEQFDDHAHCEVTILEPGECVTI